MRKIQEKREAARAKAEERVTKLLQLSVETDFEELDQMTMARLKKQLQMHRARQKGTCSRTEALMAKVKQGPAIPAKHARDHEREKERLRSVLKTLLSVTTGLKDD
eukprot:COSAG04_NODE_19518_length_414_cov_0.961905_1_plen_105_part_10